MSNIGRQLPSEMTTYVDEKTGIKVTKLTSKGTNKHLYFTENSFYSDDKSILCIRTEGTLKDRGATEMYKLDLESGILTQLTDFASEGLVPTGFNKSADGSILTAILDGDLYALSPITGERRLLVKCPAGFQLGQCSFSYDNRYIAIGANEILPENKRQVNGHENYNGFREAFYNYKRSKLIIATVDGSWCETVYNDTHWLGHVQFAPDTNEYISYCHEGPWNFVQQRIWLFNTVRRSVEPCYRQVERDSVGHEFWTRDGLVFYDNRGRGHDGTITSDKTQAVTVDYNGPDDIPEVGFVNKDGEIVRKLELPYYCNHYHANIDNTLLVADAVNDLVLIDISTDTPKIRSLCVHDTSWRWQQCHPHPTFSWSNDSILFASDRDNEGEVHLYLVRMKDLK